MDNDKNSFFFIRQLLQLRPAVLGGQLIRCGLQRVQSDWNGGVAGSSQNPIELEARKPGTTPKYAAFARRSDIKKGQPKLSFDEREMCETANYSE
jgi:hypothetical protein